MDSQLSLPRDIIATGDLFPQEKILYQNALEDTRDFFRSRVGVVIGVVGAFHPVCSDIHLKGFVDALHEFKKRGLHSILCITVNDPYVVKAWKDSLGIKDDIIFLCDASGALCQKLGLLEDHSAAGLGNRCHRSALIVGPNSVVQWVGLDAHAYAPHVLAALDAFLDQFPRPLAGPSVDESVRRRSSALTAEQQQQNVCDPFINAHDFDDTGYMIQGEPHEELFPYLEMKRSQCDLLFEDDASSVDETSSTSDTSGDAFDDTMLMVVNSESCTGLSLRNIVAKPGNENLDIKFGYECPRTAYASRVQNSYGATTLWNMTITARAKEFGYVVVDGHRFYARQLHFHFPCVHVSDDCLDSFPVEMHIVHTAKGLPRVVIVCVKFVWEPGQDKTTCVLIESLAGAVQCPHFKSDGSFNIIEGATYPLDLQGMIALNTMSAFYRYSCPVSSEFIRYMPGWGFATLQREHVSCLSITESCWLVGRDAIALSWKQFELLHSLLGGASMSETPARSLARSVSRLLTDPDLATRIAPANFAMMPRTENNDSEVACESALAFPGDPALQAGTAWSKPSPTTTPVVLVVSSLLR